MKLGHFTCLLVLIASILATTVSAHAGGRRLRNRNIEPASGDSWTGNYYEPAWGMPLALVVPPTARYQSSYSWNVGGTQRMPVGAQFQAEAQGPESVYHQGQFMPMPVQPNSTEQSGVNYVRGPR